MTPEQALTLLNNATGALRLERPAHLQLMQAIDVLRAAIGKKAE